MSVEVVPSEVFLRKAKALAKKYPSFRDDLRAFEQSLKENPRQGSDLGRHMRKVRMAIASKNEGKSGGARVITHEALITIDEGVITLLTIYDKSRQETISAKELRQLLRDCGKEKETSR